MSVEIGSEGSVPTGSATAATLVVVSDREPTHTKMVSCLRIRPTGIQTPLFANT